MLPLYGLTKFTLQDFPGHTACIVWLGGCNLRCHYCHNPEMVNQSKGTYAVDDFLAFLTTRQGKLDGVVLSGGESTLYPDIIELAQTVKEMGFKIKLDTNGLRIQTVKQMLDLKLIDYIALDYKAPPYKFKQVTGKDKYGLFSETLDVLCEQSVPFELRTTVHTDLLDEIDVQWIVDDLNKRQCKAPYYVQNYMHTETLGGLTEQSSSLDRDHLATCGSITFRNF